VMGHHQAKNCLKHLQKTVYNLVVVIEITVVTLY